jgi:hypothetical protein
LVLPVIGSTVVPIKNKAELVPTLTSDEIVANASTPLGKLDDNVQASSQSSTVVDTGVQSVSQVSRLTAPVDDAAATGAVVGA